jgi:hypothetical protein
MRDKNSNLPSRNLLVVGLQLSKSCLALYALKMLYPSPALIDNSGTQYSTWNNSGQQRSHLICSINTDAHSPKNRNELPPVQQMTGIPKQ